MPTDGTGHYPLLGRTMFPASGSPIGERREAVIERSVLLITRDVVSDCRLGMAMDEAARALRPWGELEPYSGPTEDRWHTTGPVFISVEPDDKGNVRSLEVTDPWVPPGDAHPRVLFEDIAVFESTADEVAAALSSRYGGTYEERGFSFTAPSVLVALWRDSVGQNETEVYEDLPSHWTTILVAKPGYYD